MRHEIIPMFEVDKKSAASFIESVCMGLEKVDNNSLENVFLFARDSIAISFDANYDPFLGFAPGQNPSATTATYLQKNYVLNRAAEQLQRWDIRIPGGRLLINRDNMLRHADDIDTVLCHLDWKGADPYTTILKFYTQTCAQKHMARAELLYLSFGRSQSRNVQEQPRSLSVA